MPLLTASCALDPLATTGQRNSLALQAIAWGEVGHDESCEEDEGGCGCIVRFARRVLRVSWPDLGTPEWDLETPRPEPSETALADSHADDLAEQAASLADPMEE